MDLNDLNPIRRIQGYSIQRHTILNVIKSKQAILHADFMLR